MPNPARVFFGDVPEQREILVVEAFAPGLFARLAGGEPRRLLLSPTAYQNPNEFPGKVAGDYDLWAALVASDPGVLPGDFGTTESEAIQGIIRQSRRHGGRKISRADAEEVYLAGWHGFVLLTGDNRQAEIAAANSVTAVHKFTALEYLANAAALPNARLCDGLALLIANSNRDQPCALPPDYQNRLQQIRRQRCRARP